MSEYVNVQYTQYNTQYAALHITWYIVLSTCTQLAGALRPTSDSLSRQGARLHIIIRAEHGVHVRRDSGT